MSAEVIDGKQVAAEVVETVKKANQGKLHLMDGSGKGKPG